jgi:hypothetical protein
MVNEQSSGTDAAVLARNNTVDAVVAALFTMLGIVVIIEARRLGAGWTSDGPGAGYFPFYIGVILATGGTGILWQSLLGRSRDRRAFVDREQMGRVVSVLVPSLVFAGVIMVLGQYVASAVFIAAFMIWLGKFKPAPSVLLGLAVSAFFFFMFEVWFMVPLYKGALDPLAFLGY